MSIAVRTGPHLIYIRHNPTGVNGWIPSCCEVAAELLNHLIGFGRAVIHIKKMYLFHVGIYKIISFSCRIEAALMATMWVTTASITME